MSKKGSGVAELKERLQNNPNLTFVEKAELCVYGRNYTAESWAREYSANELLDMWKSRKHEKLREVAELAESKERLEKIWNPRIGDLELCRHENFSLLDYYNLLLSVQAVFCGADSRVDSEWFPYMDRHDGSPYLHQLAVSFGEVALKVCHAALHPVWAAVLCFSRQTLPFSEEELQNGCPHEDWSPDDGVYVTDGPDALSRNTHFIGLEKLTEPVRMTTGDLQKRLAGLGFVADLKTIREAAAALGVPPLDAMRGFKAGSKKRRTAKRQKLMTSN
jgi:hypothetical protein